MVVAYYLRWVGDIYSRNRICTSTKSEEDAAKELAGKGMRETGAAVKFPGEAAREAFLTFPLRRPSGMIWRVTVSLQIVPVEELTWWNRGIAGSEGGRRGPETVVIGSHG